MTSDRAKVEAIIKVIKDRFPNVKVEEAVKMAFDILEAIETK